MDTQTAGLDVAREGADRKGLLSFVLWVEPDYQTEFPIPAVTHAEICKHFHYDPLTGIWTRIKHERSTIVGTRADKLKPDGRFFISYKNYEHLASRLAWFYMTGRWPKYLVDHKDRNTKNNCWDNLREATKSQNSANSKMRSDNKSGFRGVAWIKEKQKWRASIRLNGRAFHLGYCDDRLEASALYEKAARELFGKFAYA